MRSIIILVMSSLLLCSVVHAQGKTARERDGLEGLVQTVSVRVSTVVNEAEKRMESPRLLSYVISYDKEGNRTELAMYDSKGEFSHRIAYTYDAQSKKVSELVTYDAHNIIIRKVVHVYGSNGVKSSRVNYEFKKMARFIERPCLPSTLRVSWLKLLTITKMGL